MIQAICWVLFHSLWQGVLLALAGGGVILCTKRSAAAVRYRLLCGLLGAFLVGMGLTFFYEWTMITGAGGGSNGIGLSLNWFGEWCSAHAYPIVTVWLTLVVVKAVRMAAGWSYLRRMRRDGLAAPALWVDRVEALGRQLGMRRTVKLVESALVRVPVVIGQLKPIIYIPLGLINHLPASEMEAVLLHELAHIRRYDHVVNMVQQVAECLLFFNPGYLWISSLLREERENCCDDMAIEHTQDRVEFVRALVRFSEHRLGGAVLAFPGNKRQLLHRVLRISRQENKTLSGRERLVLLGGCILVLCLLGVRVGKAVRAEEQTMKVEGRGVKVVEVRRVSPVQPELEPVLRAQQQVAQKMEWVEAQLKQLHRKPDMKKKNGNVSNMKKRNEEVADMERKNEEVSDMTKKDEGVKREEQRDQHERAEQSVRDREQAERDRVQAEMDRIQAGRDREQAARDREQADRNREQALKDRDQADRSRGQADRDRLQAERERRQAELIRGQGELERRQAELQRLREEGNRLKAEHDREGVSGAASGQNG